MPFHICADEINLFIFMVQHYVPFFGPIPRFGGFSGRIVSMAYIIIDRITDQVLSWWTGPNTDKWDAGIDNDTDEVVGGAYVFYSKKDATTTVKILEDEFKNEPGGVNFEILKVGTETVEKKTRTGYVSYNRVFLI